MGDVGEVGGQKKKLASSFWGEHDFFLPWTTLRYYPQSFFYPKNSPSFCFSL